LKLRELALLLLLEKEPQALLGVKQLLLFLALQKL
jgi:hypothetical protein